MKRLSLRNSKDFINTMEEIENICSMPLEYMKKVAAYIQDQMIKGLKGEPSDLKMLPSFVDSVCTGEIMERNLTLRNGAGIRPGS